MSTASLSFTITVNNPNIAIVPPSPPVGTVGTPYSFQLQATGGSGTYTWTATGLPPGLTCSASGLIGGTPTSAGSFSITATVTDAPPPPPPTGVQLLPSYVAVAKAKATANTPQWQAFKAQLDANLPLLLGYTTAAYQGSQLPAIADYALGYQVLKDSDPITASNYADKAIALVKSALNDYQKGLSVEIQYLKRGDGTTKTFTLPNADFIPSTLLVFLSPTAAKAVVRGAGNTDTVDYYQKFLKVSNTSDGTADYIEGTDWAHDPTQSNSVISWLPGGHQPAAGATYYVTESLGFGISAVSGYTVSGATITFATAPTLAQSVWVAYVYGTHSADGSTLAYQQTSAGDGGLNSIFIDTTYTSRYLGKYVALGLDWLAGYVGFSATLKAQAIAQLKAWYNWLIPNGYYYTSPASNYGAGSYGGQIYTVLALQGRDSAAASMLAQMLAYRTANLLPLLQNTTNSLFGGFWAEGWNYGQLAAENILESALALEDAGQLTATAERTWVTQVIDSLLESQPSQSTIYDGGDWFTSPAPFPGKDLIGVLAATTSDAAEKSYANFVLQNYAGAFSSTARDLLFRDPTAAASSWTSALPLQDFASGTGLLTARSDWGSSPTWIAFQLGNLLACDHQTYTPGQLQIQRGADNLLINAPSVGEYFSLQRSTYGNTIVVDDNGDGAQTYRWSMGVWYGTPGSRITAYEADVAHAYAAGDYHAAYSKAGLDGAGGPTSELTRDVFYLRPNYVVVYDRVTTINAAYPKQQRWHFLNAPAVAGNGFTATAGSSKLFGQTFSAVPLTTTVTPVLVGNVTVQELITQNASAIAKLRYVSAFQVAASTVAAMDATAHVVSTDGQLEGVVIGSAVVLFVSTPPWGGSSSYSVTVPAGASSHYVAGLPAGRVCTLTGATTTTATVSAAGVLSFTVTGTGAAQTVSIS